MWGQNSSHTFLQPFDNRPYTYQHNPRWDGGYMRPPYVAYTWPHQPAHFMNQYYTYGQPTIPPNGAQPPYYYYNQQPPAGYYAPAQPPRPVGQYWQGRTPVEVRVDDQTIAAKEGAYEAHELAPRDPKPDQMFWCRELDGSWTLRTAFTIEMDLRPGRWQVDHQRGYLVYLRAAPAAA